MQAPKVSYRDFDPANLVKTPPQQKQSQPKVDPNNPNAPPQPITYFEIPLSYRYTIKDKDGGEKSVIADLYIEGPELFTPGGINSKDMNGKAVHSIFTQFDLQDPEILAFVGTEVERPGTMERLYRVVIDRLDEAKGAVGLGRMQHKMMIEGVTTYPIHWPRDATTSQVIVGKNPSKYFSLFSYGQGYSQKRTLFCAPVTDTEGKPTILDWEMLRGVEMKYRPLFHFKKIYIGGGKASIQFDVTSAVVTHIVKANTESNQTDTIETLKRDDNLTKSLRDQIAALHLQLDKSRQVDGNLKKETPGPNAGQLQLTDSNQGQGHIAQGGFNPVGQMQIPGSVTPQKPSTPQLNYGTSQPQSNPGLNYGGSQYPSSPAASQYQQSGSGNYGTSTSINGVAGVPSTLSSMLNSGPVMTGFQQSSHLAPPQVKTLH
jgi:hypothetical protein